MEVFREVQHVQHNEPTPGAALKTVEVGGPRTRKEARDMRNWMKEVKGMSRGWDGMGWGVGKDMIGEFPILLAMMRKTD